MDTDIGNTGLLVKILTYIQGYTRNTHMVTHAVILSAAKDLIARNTKDKHRIDLELRYFTQNDDQARIVATLTNSHHW